MGEKMGVCVGACHRRLFVGGCEWFRTPVSLATSVSLGNLHGMIVYVICSLTSKTDNSLIKPLRRWVDW